ncbi:MAG: DUF559 domain-containing protein [Candidatus Marinimicrobia bacterium]|nr:DUF559 domain-containing protein [Candidatus Neomarinimicrobiota bacterium]
MATDSDPDKPTGEFKQHYRIKPLKVTARRLRKRQTKSEKQLAIEIDGGIHHKADIADRDKIRQKMIEDYGIRFFRCTSNEVESNLEGVLMRILKIADEKF